MPRRLLSALRTIRGRAVPEVVLSSVWGGRFGPRSSMAPPPASITEPLSLFHSSGTFARLAGVQGTPPDGVRIRKALNGIIGTCLLRDGDHVPLRVVAVVDHREI